MKIEDVPEPAGLAAQEPHTNAEPSAQERAFYHAGPPGLREILPPNETGAPTVASFGAAAVCRRDRVYVTTSLEAAIGIASLVPPHGRGAVYEVEPLHLAPDPDCTLPGLSFEAERARVVRRVAVPGKLLKRARKIMRAPELGL